MYTYIPADPEIHTYMYIHIYTDPEIHIPYAIKARHTMPPVTFAIKPPIIYHTELLGTATAI